MCISTQLSYHWGMLKIQRNVLYRRINEYVCEKSNVQICWVERRNIFNGVLITYSLILSSQRLKEIQAYHPLVEWWEERINLFMPPTVVIWCVGCLVFVSTRLWDSLDCRLHWFCIFIYFTSSLRFAIYAMPNKYV